MERRIERAFVQRERVARGRLDPLGHGIAVRLGPVGKGAEDGRVDTPTGTPTLDKFGRDLTAMARQGKLDPVLGRALEIENTIEVLARRKKNNPVLIS